MFYGKTKILVFICGQKLFTPPPPQKKSSKEEQKYLIGYIGEINGCENEN